MTYYLHTFKFPRHQIETTKWRKVRLICWLSWRKMISGTESQKPHPNTNMLGELFANTICVNWVLGNTEGQRTKGEIRNGAISVPPKPRGSQANGNLPHSWENKCLLKLGSCFLSCFYDYSYLGMSQILFQCHLHTVALNFKLNVIRGLIRTIPCCTCDIGSENSGLNASLWTVNSCFFSKKTSWV